MGKVTIKVTLKSEKNAIGEQNVRIRITKDRKSNYWATGLFVVKKHFNPKGRKDLKNWIRESNFDHGEYNARILREYRKTEKAIEEFEAKEVDYTADQVVTWLKTGGSSEYLLDYFQQRNDRREQLAGTNLQKLATWRGYKMSMVILRAWMLETGKEFRLKNFTRKDVEDFRTWMSNRYSSSNTVAAKLMHLRRIIKDALDEKLISYEKYPFKDISISTKRRSVGRLTDAEIDQFASAKRQPVRPSNRTVTHFDHGKTLALALYDLQGARLTDGLMLRVSNYHKEIGSDGLVEHRIKYRMGKSQKERNVLLTEDGWKNIEPYLSHPDGKPKEPNEFLFPYIAEHFDRMGAKDKIEELNRARSRAYYAVQRWGIESGISKKVTPHIMRHSFADMLRRSGVDLITSQMSLGHSDPRTTRDYMESHDQGAVDQVAKVYRKRINQETIGKQNQETESNPTSQKQTESVDNRVDEN